MKKSIILQAVSVFMLFSATASAEEYVLTLKDHKFSPTELSIPAGQKVKITVKNQDSTPAEFESKDLGVEKVIVGNGSAIINVGPLKAGTYAFVDEFNEDVAKGTITVK